MPLRIDERFAGRAGKCPACSIKITVPEPQNIGPPDATVDQSSHRVLTPTTANMPLHSELHPPEPSSKTTTRSKQSTSMNAANSTEVLSNPQTPGVESTRSPNLELPALHDWSNSHSGAISIPRWIVLAQGALLGTIALTFFVFGWMVGSLTAPPDSTTHLVSKVELSGSVFAVNDGQRVADMGAVAIILPTDATTGTRPDMNLLRPDTYRPIDNEAKSIIEAAGGQVVRVNSDGNFLALMDANRTYQILIISNRATVNSNFDITKQMRAELGSFFLPLEDLLGNQAFHWQEIVLIDQSKTLNVVIFE